MAGPPNNPPMLPSADPDPNNDPENKAGGCFSNLLSLFYCFNYLVYCFPNIPLNIPADYTCLLETEAALLPKKDPL